ncbi:MAG: phosphoribosyltransferase, partial [Candidatus Hydrothermarchaeaceae archaeon]
GIQILSSMEYLRLSWEDIEKYCIDIAREVVRRKIDFDIILGLARGGWIPARLLSDILDNDEVYTIRVKFYEGVGRRMKKPLILHPTQFDVAGKKVLLVDDIADTGGSLAASVEHLNRRKVGRISVATLVKKPSSKFIPDIFAVETDAWVVFPWEVNETIRSIFQQSASEEAAVKEMKKAGLGRAVSGKVFKRGG